MTIGWYIHHHGTGHLRRFEAVRAHLGSVVALSSIPRPAGVRADEWVDLACDAPSPEGRDPTAGGVLHWAPLGHEGLRERMARLGRWLAETGARLLVCDVSVEVAAYARLMGVPVAWIAQRGRRLDPPHRLAYDIARVLAPWSHRLAADDCGLPPTTRYVGAVSRYDDRRAVAPPGRRRVLALLGGGGHAVRAQQLDGAARATPGWTWSVAGPCETTSGRLRSHGVVSDVWPLLCDADVVVASAGSNLVAEVAAARRPLICLPQPRPFGEQAEQAAALARLGLVETHAAWPAPDAWPGILDRATQRDPAAWGTVHDGGGARRLAAAIEDHACASG